MAAENCLVVNEKLAAKDEEENNARDDIAGKVIEVVSGSDFRRAFLKENQQEGNQRHCECVKLGEPGDDNRGKAVAARRAAESSLWGAPAQQQAAEAAPYNANLASMPIISGAAGIDLDDLDEPAAITASIDAQDRIDTGDLPDASLEVDVPMADYSGHEDMWAAATAILDEIDEPAPVAAPAHVAAPQSAAPAYVGRHSAVFPEDTARISRESIERAEAIAAGIMENRRHERVNQILEEEIERLQSSTAKRTGRAYLSVIEGGTASFAPLRAEA